MLNENFFLKYYKVTTFVESYFPGTVKGKLLFMFLWIVFSMQGAIAHFTILGKKYTFCFPKVPLLQLILPTARRFKTVIKTLFFEADKLHAGLNKRD